MKSYIKILNKLEVFIFVMIFLTINVTKVYHFTDSIAFNLAFSDVLVPIAIIYLILSTFKEKFSHVFKFHRIWIGLSLWIVVVGFLAIRNQGIVDAGWIGLLEELIKTVISIAYFFIGYNTLKKIDFKSLKNLWVFTGVIFIFGGMIIYLLAISGIFFWSSDPKYLHMFMGTDTDPNHAATFLTITFFAAGLFAATEFKKNNQIYFIFLASIATIGIVFTGSRGGLVGFLIGLIVLFIYYSIKNWKFAILMLTTLIIILLVFIEIDYVAFDGAFEQRLIYKLIDFDSGLETRLSLSKTALMMGNDHSLFGVGRGNYALNSTTYFEKIHFNYIDDIPHNTYFGLYAEAGIIGVILFFMPILLVIKHACAWMVMHRNKGNNTINTLIWFAAGIVALAVQAFVLNVENRRFLWYVAGIMIFIFEQDLLSIKKENVLIKKIIATKHIVMLVGAVIICYSLVGVHSNIPYPKTLIKTSWTHELIRSYVKPDTSYDLELDLRIAQNNEKTQWVLLSIVEENIDGEERVLDEYRYAGAIGQVTRKFHTTSEMAHVYVKAEAYGSKKENFTILPVLISDGNSTVDLTKWYYLLPTFISEPLIKAQSFSENLLVNQTSFESSKNAVFSDSLALKSLEFNTNSDETVTVTINYEVLSKLSEDYRTWFYGYPDNLHVMSEERISSGYESYQLTMPIFTSEWKVGKSYDVSFVIPRNFGTYELTTGFVINKNGKNDYLPINEGTNKQTNTLLLGTLNLDEKTEGEKNE